MDKRCEAVRAPEPADVHARQPIDQARNVERFAPRVVRGRGVVKSLYLGTGDRHRHRFFRVRGAEPDCEPEKQRDLGPPASVEVGGHEAGAL